MTTVCTIGFTKRSLQSFVEGLREAGVEKVIDTRLRPSSQLSGWAKADDLKFVLSTYEHIEYEHDPQLAPTGEILDEYRATKNWDRYTERFTALMAERDMLSTLRASIGERNVVALLCSEATAEQCHRRLLAEALREGRSDVSIQHL